MNQQIQVYKWKGWKVYKITFPDEFEYVGITVYDIETRIRGHLYRPVNAELKRRLETMPYQWEILADNLKDMSEAYALEQVYIDRLQKPININGVDPRKRVTFGHEQTEYNRGRKHRKRTPRHIPEPRKAKFRCSCCGEVYDWTCFDKDTGRFNGLDSRCKPCRYLTAGKTHDVTKEMILSNREFYHKIYWDMKARQQRKKDAYAFAEAWVYQEYLPPPKRIGKPYGKNKTRHWVEIETAIPRRDGTLNTTLEYVMPKRFYAEGMFRYTRYLTNIEVNIFKIIERAGEKYEGIDIAEAYLATGIRRELRNLRDLLDVMQQKGFLKKAGATKEVLYYENMMP